MPARPQAGQRLGCLSKSRKQGGCSRRAEPLVSGFVSVRVPAQGWSVYSQKWATAQMDSYFRPPRPPRESQASDSIQNDKTDLRRKTPTHRNKSKAVIFYQREPLPSLRAGSTPQSSTLKRFEMWFNSLVSVSGLRITTLFHVILCINKWLKGSAVVRLTPCEFPPIVQKSYTLA